MAITRREKANSCTRQHASARTCLQWKTSKGLSWSGCLCHMVWQKNAAQSPRWTEGPKLLTKRWSCKITEISLLGKSDYHISSRSDWNDMVDVRNVLSYFVLLAANVFGRLWLIWMGTDWSMFFRSRLQCYFEPGHFKELFMWIVILFTLWLAGEQLSLKISSITNARNVRHRAQSFCFTLCDNSHQAIDIVYAVSKNNTEKYSVSHRCLCLGRSAKNTYYNISYRYRIQGAGRITCSKYTGMGYDF